LTQGEDARGPTEMKVLGENGEGSQERDLHNSRLSPR
jgi:hypothetical protein